jgi:hypothetical protein
MEKKEAMNSTEIETRSEPTEPEQRVERLGSFALVHLAACLGTGGAVILAIGLIEWLG